MAINADQLKWETSPCAWCGSTDSRVVFSGTDRTHALPGVFTMVECLHCGTIRQNPRLVWDSLQQYYPEDYNSYFPMVREIANPLLRLEHRYGPWKRMRAIQRRQPGGHLLEVGCGSGLLLEEALRSGRWQVTGLEINSQAANKVRQALNIPVIEAPLQEANFPDNSFDVIVYWNVLEHLYQPIQDLRLSYQLLKSGGWLVIGLPNLESWERRLFAQDWIGWELPRHLHLFPGETLRTILESIGFQWDWSGCISSSHATLGLSLQIWAQAQKNNRLPRMLLRLYRSYLGKLASLPGLWIADRLGRSTILAVFVQKPLSD